MSQNDQGGNIRLLPEQLPAAIALFETARDQMDQLARRAEHETVVRPPGKDQVSTWVAEAMTKAGREGLDSAAGAANSAVVRLEEAIVALKEMGRTYGVVEEDNTRRFNG